MKVKSRKKIVYKMTQSQKTVIESVCIEMGIDYKTIMGKSRMRYVVMGRNFIFYFFRQYLGVTVSDTGRIFQKDHTTIIPVSYTHLTLPTKA